MNIMCINGQWDQSTLALVNNNKSSPCTGRVNDLMYVMSRDMIDGEMR